MAAITDDRPRPSNVFSYCLVSFLICLESACLTYANPWKYGEICGADGFNIRNLTKTPYWYFDADGKDCPADSISCQYSFSICNRLPFDCDNCSVSLEVNDTGDYMGIGKYDQNHNPILSIPGDTRFSVLYTYGEIHSILDFICNISVKWILEEGNSSRVPDAANTQILYTGSGYTFTFYSAEACYIPPTVLPYEPHGGLSTGSILLLIFFPTLIIYFILGIILNKVGGANGKELIPNYEFWNSLPGLIADGVVFTWSMMTCQGSKGVSGYDSI